MEGKGEMSLQVWLPLTKDLRQQGLSNTTVTNNGATYSSTGGKLGGCYYFNNTYAWSTLDYSSFDTVFSVAFWYKIGTAFSGNRHLVCLANTYGWANLIFTCVATSTSTFSFNIGNGSTSDRALTCPQTVGSWQHIVFTFNNKSAKVYVNGVLYSSGTYSINPDWSKTQKIGLGGTPAGQEICSTLYLNDVRVYNHCLSPMEVKQLSQGLVLHYPLNRQGWGQDNLVVNYRNSGNAAYYSTTLSAQVYEVDSSMPSGYHQKCTIGTASGTGGPYWVGTTTNGNTGTQISQLTADAWYTVSYYIKGTTTHSSVISTTAEFLKNITFVERPTINTGWQRVTFYGQYNGNTTSNIAITIYEGSKWTAGEVFYFSSLKVEPGKIRTQWTPHSSDILYTTMGLNGVTEYDCSGFCNNGEKTSGLTYTSDTPKYSVSTHIGATTQKIHISNLPTSGFGNSYSFAWWGKRSSNNPMFWGFSDGIRLNGMYTGTLWNTGDSGNNPIYNPGTTTTITAPSVNVWHHYVMTGDGTTCKLYVDGVLYGQAKTYKAISGTSIYINGWDSSASYCSDNTDISDFRIYATALSASDVLSLYQNCATIDADGTIHGQIRS